VDHLPSNTLRLLAIKIQLLKDIQIQNINKLFMLPFIPLRGFTKKFHKSKNIIKMDNIAF